MPVSSFAQPFERRRMLAASAAMGFAPWLGAQPQPAVAPLPQGPFHLVVGASAGDSIDLAARLLARHLGTFTDRTFVVDNQPGANGIIAAEYAAKARASGAVNILVGMASQLLLNQMLYSNMPLDLRTDLQRLYLLSKGSLYLCVNPAITPVDSMQALLRHLQANRGKLSHGAFGRGSYPHLMGIRLNQLTGADMVQVPYKGETPLVQALLSGELNLGWISTGALKRHAERLLPLAGNGPTRMHLGFREVPTFAEVGLHDEAFTLQGWIGTAVAAHTPEPVKRALGQAIHRVMNQSGIVAQYANLGIAAETDSSPAQFEAFYQQVYPQWERLLKTVGVRRE